METVPIPGCPRSAIGIATIQQVEAAILEDLRVTVRHLVHEFKISVGSVEKIIHDHSLMGKVSALWILRLVISTFTEAITADCAEVLVSRQDET